MRLITDQLSNRQRSFHFAAIHDISPFFGRAGASIDASIVAMGRACEGGRAERWCASTLELQLASHELCRARWSVPTLHVRVDYQTRTDCLVVPDPV